MKNKFSEELRKWRGRRAQSKAAALLDVNLSTYQNWEYGRNEPSEYSKSYISQFMEKTKETQ